MNEIIPLTIIPLILPLCLASKLAERGRFEPFVRFNPVQRF